MNHNVIKCLATLAGAVLADIAPTAPYVALCTVAIFADCLSAYLLNRRVKQTYNTTDGKFKSVKLAKVIRTLVYTYALLIFAYYLEQHITSDLPWDSLKIAAGAVIAWQGLSILENASSCNGAKWARFAQTILIDKTARHLDIDEEKIRHALSDDEHPRRHKPDTEHPHHNEL